MKQLPVPGAVRVLGVALFAAVAVLVAIVVAVPAAAQAPAADQDARVHFRQAIEQFNEGNLDAALAEFQRAYEIDPAAAILYNIARVYAGQGNAVQATQAYERYLRDGGAEITGERRQDVEVALATQRRRIGYLEVVVSVDGATIAFDGVDVASSPIREPIAVNAGTVVVEVRAASHDVARRRVGVAGGSTERVVVELREAVRPGQLRLDCSIPDVVVEIDGTNVGETPFDTTLNVSVGDHRLVARRPGYATFEREFHMGGNSSAEIELEMVRDEFASAESLGTLTLRLPDASYVATVDGQPVNEADLRALPVGRHRLELEVEDRLPFRATVDIRAGGQTEVAPALEWTPAARQGRVEGAATHGNIGIGLTIGGVVVGVTGVSLAIWNESEVANTDALLREANQNIVMACGMGGSPECDAAVAAGRALLDDVDRQQVIRGVAWGLGIAGVVSTAIGLVMWLGAPNEEAIDAAAHARVDVVPLEGGAMVASTISFD